MSKYQLVVCEKNSVAKSIAAVLNANERKDGFFIGNNYIITWCAGHLLEPAPPDAYDSKYKKWNYADLPIIPEKWIYLPIKGKEKQLDIIKGLMNRPDVENVINACDSGREGELIFRHVFNYAACTKPMLRLWISSMEDAAIKKGFENLQSGTEYDSLYAAALCREKADYIVGYTATRLFSVLYNTTLNTGRVQSPTLAMLANRESDIANFVKKPFYTPTLEIGTVSASGEKAQDKPEAEKVKSACDGKSAAVQSVEKQKKTEAPPKLYDLTALQRDANRLFGFTAQQTLDYAQSLYEKAILSYPRTDSRYLTSDMRDTAAQLVAMLQYSSPLTGGKAYTPDIDRLIDDRRVSDHYAIIPTPKIAESDLSALPSGERDIANLVATRLLCATAEPHTYESAKVIFSCDRYSFTATGKSVLSDGWKAIDQRFRKSLKEKPDDKDSRQDDNSLPQFTEGQGFDSVAVTIKEGMTSPPKHYTEDTLLSSMETAGKEDLPENAERKGLGTPATRAATIEKLVKTNLVERSNRNIISSDKGKNLIAVLPDSLKSPSLTSDWENKLMYVQSGQVSENEFMDEIKAFITAIVENNAKPIEEYIKLFKDENAQTVGKCPRCGSQICESPKGYFCQDKSCGFCLWKDSKFWTSKKAKLTADIVSALLKERRVIVDGLYSQKTGKTYSAIISLDDTGKYVNYKMEFLKR